MAVTYEFVVRGHDAGGVAWTTRGTIRVDTASEFPKVANDAMLQSFDQLTKGKATYGEPGKTCSGPYTIETMLISRA